MLNHGGPDQSQASGTQQGMPNFGGFSILDRKKRKVRSNGKQKKNGNIKCKICAKKKNVLILSVVLNNHNRYGLLSIKVLCLIPFYVI